jgi:hypothetical protein
MFLRNMDWVKNQSILFFMAGQAQRLKKFVKQSLTG